MYDPHVLLEGVDDHVVPFLALSAVSFAGLIVWYYEAIKVGERHRSFSMPPVITMVWLAHDATLVAHFSDWFGGPYDHWLMQLYWVAMLGTSAVEVFFVVQLVRFGRRELAPSLSQAAFTVAVLVAQAAAFVIWLSLKRIIDDDLFQVTFALTAAMFPPFGMSLLLRRGSRRGQTVNQWIGFTIAPAFWFLATIVAYGPPFRSALWISLGIVTTAWGALTAYLLARAPDPQQSGASDGGSGRGMAPPPLPSAEPVPSAERRSRGTRPA
ncbi:MAG TPA: hypothetical protein VEG38_07225 [Acidimicrobiia bacterium]|nr:hypothetical protein [Acidimicrobiia bacterium]